MKSHLLACGIAAVLLASGVISGSARATIVEYVDAADDADGFKQRQIDLFDSLRADPSPRQQVLVADEYLPENASAAALRPKLGEVVARAVNLAPDDAFVQWYAAQSGSFTSSSCGPTTWPEAEVANLIRLEPDNGVTWTFAIALASAIGDEDGVDDALSRLASASRADDHAMEAFTEWRQAFDAGHAGTSYMPWLRDVPSDIASFTLASAKLASVTSPAAAKVAGACGTDGGERTWRRLGWCAEGGRLLASKGNSLELRRLGLDMLEAIGDRNPDVLALAHQYAWLARHDPASAYVDIHDVTATRTTMEDWKHAASHVEVLERRIARAGKPVQVPADWVVPRDEDEDTDDHDAATAASMAYSTELIAALLEDADPEKRAVGWLVGQALGVEPNGNEDAQQLPDSSGAPIRDMPAAHPDSVLVQWIATRDPASRDMAVANLQRLDPGNLAVWLPSIAPAASGRDATDDTLARAASATRHQQPMTSLLRAMLDVVGRHPPPAGLKEVWSDLGYPQYGEPETIAYASAMAMASLFAFDTAQLGNACSARVAPPSSERRANCTAVARRLLHEGNMLISALMGGSVLVSLGELDERDRTRLRSLSWWSELVTENIEEERQQDLVRDLLETDSEVETARRAATRLGKTEPPADWTPSREIRLPTDDFEVDE